MSRRLGRLRRKERVELGRSHREVKRRGGIALCDGEQLDARPNGGVRRYRVRRRRSRRQPTWSHDGSFVVYTSSTATVDGRAAGSDADLYVVPFANKMGGTAKPIAGAAEATVAEYYPSLSPDDAFVAYNHVNVAASSNVYNEPQAEVYVVPATGGTPTRLAANDPAACAGTTSPGLTNSWPKWAPEATSSGGKTYYWLTFSSRRMEGNSTALRYRGRR